MPAKSNSLPVVLPARMSLTENAFDDLEIAVFDFPFKEAIDRFTQKLKGLLQKKRLEWSQYPPYRLLNNAIVACSPTVVHGFEKYGVKNEQIRRMLAIGKIDRNSKGVKHPTEEQISELILIWIQVWGQQGWLKPIIQARGKTIWHELLDALQAPPQTQWRKITPTALLEDLYAEKGLAFNAVPSLLSTLLHGKTSTIADREVKWRKAQNSSNRLCVVSQPLPISFMRKSSFKESTEEGFFSYKLEFHVQTQAGRNKPWIYAFLHCQRYAEKKLTRNQRWNDITILLRMNRQRMDGWEIDPTLVRLKAQANVQKGDWLDKLPQLLEEFGARSLVSPVEIYANPKNFWGTENTNNSDDEYYVIHTEGYKYGRSTHKVQTGFGLAEQSEIIDRTCCDLLQGVLQPDRAFEPDPPIFSPKALPRALWTFENLSESPPLMTAQQGKKQGLTKKQRDEKKERETHQKKREQQYIPAEAVKRALRGKFLTISIIYQEQDTCDAIYQQLRETFLLNEEDPFPENLTIIKKPIFDLQLGQHLDVGDLKPEMRHKSPSSRQKGFDDQWNKAIQKAHREKREAWRNFLETIKTEEEIRQDSFCVAIIERLEEPTLWEKFHPDQGIKGSIREACDREGILSQMIRGVQWKIDEETKDKERSLKPADKGRTHNAVQDLIIRQLGVLYDPPNTIYQEIGIPEQQARELDVVAFALIKKQIGVTYALAVRLRASGEVDVLLPKETEWMPYPEAGYQLGQIFAQARRYFNNGKMQKDSPVSLNSKTLVKFVEDTLTQKLERPTIAIIEAENWRNQGAWEQLKNDRLSQALDRLELGEIYKRDDSELSHLLGIIRLRTGDETPQYITNRETWEKDGDRLSRDLYELSGFVERSHNEVFHYFSIGRLPSTIKGDQRTKSREDRYKIEDAGGIPFKHSQAIEMVPFFMHPYFQTEENFQALCRVSHYLRFSPAWTMGNIVLPYPMHLGEQLIKDRLCILGTTD